MTGPSVTLTRDAYVAPAASTLVSIGTDDDLTPEIDITSAAFGGLLVPAKSRLSRRCNFRDRCYDG